MSHPAEQQPPSVATLRLIVTGMIVGLCVIGGAVLFSASRIGGKIFANPMLGYVFAGIAVVLLLVQWRVVPKLFKTQKVAATTGSQLLRVYGAEVLARVGLLEAAAVLQYVNYLLSLHEWSLAAGIVLVVAILFLRPSNESFRRWCESP